MKVLQEKNELNFDKFMSSGCWCYDFSDEKGKRAKFDSEASFLSQMIFMKILSKSGIRYFSFHKNRPKIVLEDNDRAIEFSFDVMNNPKLKGERDRDQYRLGSIAKRNSVDCMEWESIYHTIGNFTPIPNYATKSRHLQLKHNDFNERWDLLLDFCKREWEKFSCNQLFLFSGYMKATIQEMYFEEIYEDFLHRLNNRSLSELSSEELLNWKNEWDKRIDKEELHLISFGNKKSIELPIRKIVDKICILIELRGRMILAYLNNC